MDCASCIGLWLMVSLSARGGTSADYSLDPIALDQGGALASSMDYAVNSSFAPGLSGQSADYMVRSGYAGQLFDLSGIVITAASSPLRVNERDVAHINVLGILDDSTRQSLPRAQILWSLPRAVASGIDANGMITAASVYQDSSGVVRADYKGYSASLWITVINTGMDDYGTFGSDGLPDVWQVQYFGESGLRASPRDDADFDGLTNLQEYAFGTDPSQSFGGMLRWGGGVLLERGVPTPFASGTAGSFTFRAVFARRKNYLSAGLSYVVEFSGDLSTWRASTSTPAVLGDDGEIEAVSVPYPFFVNGKKATYFRVRVQSK